MKFTIEARYDKCEVEEIIMLAHRAKFGAAPDGMMWCADLDYTDSVVVKAVSEVKS